MKTIVRMMVGLLALPVLAGTNPSLDFESDPAVWPLTSEYRIGEYGMEFSRGLRCQREDALSYRYLQRPLELQSATRYRIGVWVRTEDIQGEGASAAIEWHQDGIWVDGVYFDNVADTGGEWRYLEKSFLAPPGENLRASMLLYLRKGTTGKADFDNISIRAEEEWRANLLIPAQLLWQARKSAPVEIRLHSGGADLAKIACRLLLERGTQQVASRECQASAELTADFGPLPEGEYTLRLELLKSDSVVQSLTWPIRVRETLPTVRIDEFGRTLVDGKPFMPLGMYTMELSPESLRRIADAGFNAVMPYGSGSLHFGEEPSADPVAAVREVLDRCAQEELKVIYSIKDYFPGLAEPGWNGVRGYDEAVTANIEAFRDHPAILAWYICDELSASRAGEIQARRTLVKKLDPEHPSWAVYYQLPELAEQGAGQDIIGIDPYPVRAPGPASQQLVRYGAGLVRRYFGNHSGGVSTWAVIQAHNLGVYYAGDARSYAEYRDPEAQEMFAMALTHAMYGARGFVFFSDHDLYKIHGWQDDPAVFPARWERMKRVAAALRAMEPFWLATEEGQVFPVLEQEGDAEVRVWRDEAERRAFGVSAVGPGACRVRFRVPDGFQGKSLWGAIVSVEPGIYEFIGNGIAGDCLIEESK